MTKMKYINKIKGNISIYSSKRATNILDGLYRSIYKGRSMDFDDLREYNFGDDIKDIDWKSSARSGELLIRRYIAEKKHNIMCIIDTGKKMLADTKMHEQKKEVALITAGTLSYIANNHGDFVSFIYNKNNSIEFIPFKSRLSNIELALNDYIKNMDIYGNYSIEELLKYVKSHIKRKMVIFVITDISGMDSIEENTLRELSISNDIMVISISDAYMIGDNAYDVDSSRYIPKLILQNSKLNKIEEEVKRKVYSRCINKFKKYNISSVTIDSQDQIVDKIINLLERHKNANIR